MDVESERRRRQPVLQRQAGQDVAFRREDERPWNRPPRAARPHSCIEGKVKDEWLQTLNSLQTNEALPYLQKNNTPRSESPSLVPSSQSSLESLCSGLEHKERVQIKTGPNTQRAEVCCLAPVQIGWLPLQRHVVRKDDQQDGNSCKVKLKPPITPVLRCSSVRANGSEFGEWAGVRGMSGAFSVQADAKRKATLAERDRDTALDRAGGVPNRTSPDRFLWQTPVHRRRSVPQVSLLSEPSLGGRTSLRHSSSISSITITSRKVSRSSSLPDTSMSDQDRYRETRPKALNNHITEPDLTNSRYPTKITPQRKAVVVKITEQRVKTSRFLQPGSKNGPVYSHPSSWTTSDQDFSPLSNRRSSDLTSSSPHKPSLAFLGATGRNNHTSEMSTVTHTERHSQVPFCPVTQEPQTPVVLRRKAAIIKVHEESDSFSSDVVNHRRNAPYRHSFADFKPQSDNTHTLPGSSMRDGITPKLYKSTVSLHLTSSYGACLDDSRTRGSQPRRPASCYASLFSPVEPRAEGSQDVADHSTVLPHETNIDLACSTASSLNRCWSTERGAGSHDKIYPRTESSASDKGQSKREPALLRNQPLTLIKMPDSTTSETHDAIVALNAAAIIASIKLQSEQKRKILTSGNNDGQKGPESQRKAAGAGADEANIAERSVTASRPVESEIAGQTGTRTRTRHGELASLVTTGDALLSQPHTLREAPEHQRSDFIRQSPAKERQHLFDTHTHTSESFGSGSE